MKGGFTIKHFNKENIALILFAIFILLLFINDDYEYFLLLIPAIAISIKNNKKIYKYLFGNIRPLYISIMLIVLTTWLFIYKYLIN